MNIITLLKFLIILLLILLLFLSCSLKVKKRRYVHLSCWALFNRPALWSSLVSIFYAYIIFSQLKSFICFLIYVSLLKSHILWKHSISFTTMGLFPNKTSMLTFHWVSVETSLTCHCECVCVCVCVWWGVTPQRLSCSVQTHLKRYHGYSCRPLPPKANTAIKLITQSSGFPEHIKVIFLLLIVY